jgi:toxin secretion/phage lysis holin
MEGTKITVASILGAIASYVCGVWVFVAFVVVAILLDYITGLLAGRANGGLNSKWATKGLYKKVGIFMLLVLGLFLDGAVNHFMVGMDFLDLPFHLPIAHIVTVWIVITEAISVCENLERLGVPIPGFLVRLLRKVEKKIDDKGDKADD